MHRRNARHDPAGMKPSVSAMHAMVLAVPITPHVPAVLASRPSISLDPLAPSPCPPDTPPNTAGNPCTPPAARPDTATPASARSPSARSGRPTTPPPSTAPAPSCRSRRSGPPHPSAAPPASPPYPAPPDSGNASTVGNRLGSHRLTVGNGIGSPPAASTPRLAASISSGAVRWQLLNADAGIDDADHRLIQHRLRIAHALIERPAQVGGELRVAIARRIAAEAVRLVGHGQSLEQRGRKPRS